uniref:Rab5-bind domain-containing protein n=1 Tax=Glossina austeni TaxID=7395 RepID=A0A1A9VKR6_GLOAU
MNNHCFELILITIPCSNCPSLENESKELIEEATEDHNKIEDLQKKIREFNEELSKEAALCSDLESQWGEKRKAYKNEVTASEDDDIMKMILCIAEDREKVNKRFEVSQTDNDFPSGRYLATAEKIESQHINLLYTVEELQELILKQQEQLIKTRLGCDCERKRGFISIDKIRIFHGQQRIH